MSTVKTTGEFIDLVRKMRLYQKSWYDQKSAFSQEQAKKYETLVDEAIAERDARINNQHHNKE